MDNRLRTLIQKCVANDRDGQHELYKLLSPVMYGICLKYMKTTDEANDVFQDAFILLFQKINQYKFEGSFEGWAKRIFVNEALRVLRQKQHHLHVTIDERGIDTFVEEDEKGRSFDVSQEELLKHVQQLRDNYRQVFNLYVFEGYSHKTIADTLKIAVGTSKSLLSRAKSVLRTKIKEEFNQKVS